MTALGGHVDHVVLLLTKEQVIWIHAKRVVTVVTNDHPIRDFAMRQNPRHAVCVDRALTLKRELSVSGLLENRGLPRPAAFCFLDFRPKTTGQRALLLAPAVLSHEGCAAMRALDWCLFAHF